MDLVSAVMITGKSPARRKFAYAAVKSFLQQTWPEKELIIINDGAPLYGGPHNPHPPEGVFEELVRSGWTLGELRNEGLRLSKGIYVCQWDDDDFSHPQRIEAQMALAKDGVAVLLKYQLRYSFCSNRAIRWRWNYKPNPGIPGTVLHWNGPNFRYRHERKREDDNFLQDHFKGSIVVLDDPNLSHYYLRFYHGENTWDEPHVMGRGFQEQGVWKLNRIESAYLEAVLRQHYGCSDAQLAHKLVG